MTASLVKKILTFGIASFFSVGSPSGFCNPDIKGCLELHAKFEDNKSANLNSPIWISLTLTNTSKGEITYFINADLDRAVVVSPPAQAKYTLVTHAVAIETILAGEKIESGESKTFHILLNELITIQRPGTIEIPIQLALKKITPPQTACQMSLRFNVGGPLNDKDIAEDVRRYVEAFNASDDPAQREEFTRSVVAFPLASAKPLVELALRDKDEDVQLAAMKVVGQNAWQDAQLSLDILQIAVRSKYESVSDMAKFLIRELSRKG